MIAIGMKSQIVPMLILMGAPCGGARLSPAAAAEFDRYVAGLEARINAQHASAVTSFATLNAGPARRAALERELLAGGRSIEAVDGGTRELRGALLHHWRAAAYVPHATPEGMLALLRDYQDLPSNYAPEVISSRILEQRGDTARLALRLKEQKVITIVLDAEYRVESRLIGGGRGVGFSRSAHIWEVDSSGTRRERRRAEGNDDGFLWRLNSYWTFGRMRDGLLIECEAVSLTRDVPLGLDWLIEPVIQDLPREALEFTLAATKKALMKEAR